MEDDVRKDFTADVELDPDNLLDETNKAMFRELCKEFSDVIQYNPGTYNGAYGFVRNSIEFTSIPPSNNKCYVPKYSKEQTDRLADRCHEN